MSTPTRRRPTRPKTSTVPTALALCTCCHSYLAENLLGELRCPTGWCPQHGQVAGRVGVAAGALADVLPGGAAT